MKKIILKIYYYFEHHPVILWSMFFLIVVAFAFCLLRLNFMEDISTFIPQKEENRRANYAYQHLGASNKIMINVTSVNGKASSDEMIEAVEEVVAQLQETDSMGHIKELFYQIDESQILQVMQFVVQNMPYYLTADDYKRMDTLLTADNIARQMRQDKEVLSSPMGGMAKNLIGLDPLHFSSTLLEHLSGIQHLDNYELLDGYVFTKDKRNAILVVTSKYPVSETSQNELLINNIDNVIAKVQAHHQGQLKIDCIGAAVISIGNANRIKTDSVISTLLALIFILVLLMFFFKDVRAILIILFSVLFGGAFALAFLALFKGSVSIIAIGVGSIIVGLAVNYPLHFLAHYQQGYSKEQTITDIIPPLLTGNITTVGAFLSLIFISSDAMKDLGLFAALLLLGTIVFVLIFLPHLFLKSLFRNQERTSGRLLFGKIANFQLESNKWVVIIILLLTIPLYFFSTRTTFESDMNAINYMTPEHRAQMKKLTATMESGNPTLYCVAEGNTVEEALQLYEKSRPIMDSLSMQGRVVKNSGIDIFLPSQALQRERIAQWNDFWKTRRDPLLKRLKIAAKQNGYTANAFSQFEAILDSNYTSQDIHHFEPIVNSVANSYISIENGQNMIYSILETSKGEQKNVSEVLDHIDDNVYTFDNRSIMAKMIDALSGDFDYVLYICGLIVFVFLTISFGRIELSLISFLPLTVGWIWILGIMGICDIKFNIVNIILATFIFGQGDDYTIFVTEGMMYEYTYRKKMLASYKNSVLLSASIMFIGIGSLIFAKHPAMHSLAEVTIVGMFTVVLMAYLFPPLIFKWMTTRKGKPRRYPITLLNLLKTVVAFVCFFVFSILLSVWGLLLLGLCGRSTKHKLIYHKTVCYLFRMSIWLLPQVKYSSGNVSNETFEKPGIIISNHQSQLDVMYLLALNPKIICLTNNWVWNCPFYRWIIRFADYYPIIDRVEENRDLLSKAIAEGYSVLVFPEATRSQDNSILRFHKGAFYMADQLKVDIIPVLLHGVGDVFPKHEWLLRKGHVHIEILPRCTATSPLRNGNDYRVLAQNMRRYYTEEYQALCNREETADYFAHFVLHNYIYKGKEIKNAVRKSLNSNHNYVAEIAQLPDEGTYYIDQCGYGEFAFLAALVKKDLQIVATDSNIEKLAVARNCAFVPANLIYVENDQ